MVQRWGQKAHVPVFIREVVVVVDGGGNRGRRGRHEVDRCKASYWRLASTSSSVKRLRTVEDIGKARSPLSKTHDRVETATLDGVA